MEETRLFPYAKGHIGTDESGKGDFFGPLVIAAFFLPEGQAGVLRELGVRDSKRISDRRVEEIAAVLKTGYVWSVVAVGPEKYNELYAKLRNLNRLLAWGHARAIENVLEKVEAGKAITDRFGDEAFVRNALMKKGREIELVQQPRAEFLSRLRSLSRDAGLALPKGASDIVERAAVELVRRDGPGVLEKFAKTHFKTAQRVLQTAGRA